MRQVGQYWMSSLLAQWDEAHPSFDEYCHRGEKVWHNDKTLEGWERLAARMDAGVLHRGRIA